MDKERGNDQEKGDKGESNLERVRLESYVGIGYDEFPNEDNEVQEGNQEKKTDNNININGTEGCPIGSRSELFSDTYPCGVCGQDLGKRYKSVLCTGCQHWCHLARCSGLTNEKQYKKNEYRCPSCEKLTKVTPEKENHGSHIDQKGDEGNKENVDKNKNSTEKLKVRRRRKFSLYDNAPIITGGREYPDATKNKIKRKRKTREEETSESTEKKSDTEKSPTSKKKQKSKTQRRVIKTI